MLTRNMLMLILRGRLDLYQQSVWRFSYGRRARDGGVFASVVGKASVRGGEGLQNGFVYETI